MKTKEFFFDLPEELIAQTPSERRGASHLLVLDKTTGKLTDSSMEDFASFLPEDAVMVINNSKVRKARAYGISGSGGKVEFLFLEENADQTWNVMVTKSKKQKSGKEYVFHAPDGRIGASAQIIRENPDGTKTVSFNAPITEAFFQECGHVPLPPYIKREDTFSDESRYQTIYARPEGSVAAPTAGLHFTGEILDSIRERGVQVVPVTLHVGPGTFLPMRVDDIEDHHMHYERYEVPEDTARIVTDAKANNRPVIAVGTTSIRTLESAWDSVHGMLTPGQGRTNLFITPGFTYRVANHLLTNFHTPESTLLVLVSAFAGKDLIFSAYHHAIERRYHFFSYGDAMFIR
ncbi:tRNA preQ1(34) S-adenosylmethionine ribosyltransferase-isomerase QueA [Parasphaerochaeta coccoides]|uniref:S-adenosylmethionine:tRNA ribosyltransferase-isomerase n=1 Tax=Parasphaerochaeta coccoides (strain ATCC BAA-1237 / DSM 17374 / SPN1) TaxID=760011 RepID=F4GK42_PARC1|nr:tRNA preQ1(34) S-adenosylmethionine ribosyltransferase-isomerase QueA [Parasphaerochaeta coccoides]AEC01814.1 S-adenosylmethionine--tRNA ribosyltransferase-isomerase [Parasphaerochaeta coccoides DSM 17374]